MSAPCCLESMLQEQLSSSVGECLVSGSACSVGELFVSDVPEEDCSHHTGSHSMGEVWNCHCFETHVSIKQVQQQVGCTYASKELRIWNYVTST
jgi:hypothetical protein